jgi:hypothetical protein
MDTCGIFNLHGIPGIIAFICGAISISSYDSELKDLPFGLNSIEVRHVSVAIYLFINVLASAHIFCQLFQHRKSSDLAMAQFYMLASFFSIVLSESA